MAHGPCGSRTDADRYAARSARSARLRLEPATRPHRRPSTELWIASELARCLGTTNVIESPNLVVRRVSGGGANYKDAQTALRRIAANFTEVKKSFRKLRGYAQMKTLLNALRSNAQLLKKSALLP